MSSYQENIQKYTSALTDIERQLSRLSSLRLAAFIIPAIVVVLLANSGAQILTILALPIWALIFGETIRRHNKSSRQRNHLSFLKEINEQEIQRLAGDLSNSPSGQEFIDTNHPYIADFDVFGKHSLFQLIKRTTTESADLLLASWLAEPANNETILKRQEAIKELEQKEDWRQEFQASGMHFKNAKSDFAKLLTWVETPPQMLAQRSKHFSLAVILALASTVTGLYYFVHAFSPDWPLYLMPVAIVLIINSLLLKKVKHLAMEMVESTRHNIKILGGYYALITKIESEEFNAEVLKKLQAVMKYNGYSAALEINRLKKTLEAFQMRTTKSDLLGGNKLYPIVNLFWLFDIHGILLTEQWKFKNSAHLKLWVEAVSEFEVLNSLAGFAHANPTYTFPKIKELPYHISFEQLGHPLLKKDQRVCNDYDLTGRGKIDMITGSNMAGKSTFLRTLGINLVLAFTGAPCCASSGEVSNMRVFSSMRTQDNLEEGVSSFYAELKRIEQLLKLVEDDQPIFFLLDEMFKGTNSKDRHKGGFSLIKQLGELNSFGIISTHDLELASLAEKHGIITSYSFNSEILEGEMYFNYKLTPGLCKDFNASELMRRSGIKVLSEIEEEPSA